LKNENGTLHGASREVTGEEAGGSSLEPGVAELLSGLSLFQPGVLTLSFRFRHKSENGEYLKSIAYGTNGNGLEDVLLYAVASSRWVRGDGFTA
jgi:hypothetical protein